MGRKSNLEKYINQIKDYYYRFKVIPNFDTVLKILNLTSKASIHKIFKKLVELWYLNKNWNKFTPWKKLLSIPMFENIKAWFPSPANEENRSDIDISDYLIKKPNSTILLKVKWDSMINEWIKNWDIVVVDKSITANNNNIVIAIVDWEYTMKYLIKDKWERIFLRSANPEYKDIYPENELQIFGTVTWVIRKYNL